MHKHQSYWRILLVLGFTIGGTVACSGSKSDEEGLVPSTEADAEGAGAPQAEGGAAETADAAAKDGSDETASDASAEAAGSAAVTGDAASPVPAATAPAPTGVSSQAMAATPPPGKDRVVRHVKVKQATLRSGPSAKAEPVGQLSRGERIIVDVENGWGRIADGLYIKLTDTAPKPVAVRRQRAAWMPPAH